MAKPVSPADGPIAVTGASGYIGSWIVRDCAERGYDVRACVRDANRPEKTDHLLALNDDADLRGTVALAEGDLLTRGSYDDAFADCCAVLHAGAAVGYNRETPQQVYDGCFTEVKHVLDSAVKAGVRRFVFTSSFAAVGHPRPEGYVFTEKDWCGDNVEAYKGRWTRERIPENRDLAYSMAKAEAERMLYREAERNGGFDAMSILPLHVIGPLMCANHDQGWSWQNCIRYMMTGQDYKKSRGGRMLWNIVDVRDVARAHRLAAESKVAKNGARYILAAADRSGELRTWQLQAKLKALFPSVAHVGGEEMDGDAPAKHTYDSPRSYCLLAKEELGLRPFTVDEAVRTTVDSYYALGLLP